MTSPYPDFGLTPAQRRAAVLDTRYEKPDCSQGPEIWLYSDRWSYEPGDTVALFICATAKQADIQIWRDGAALTPLLERRGIAVGWQDTPDQCSVEGCGWAASLSFTLPKDAPSGAYRIKASIEGAETHHLIILRPSPAKRKAAAGRILQIAATGTWAAYNTWGGSNHYEGITGPSRTDYAPLVSRERPLCRGFVVLPPDAPRVPLRRDPPPASIPRYPHMEWAYATGHSKKYASAGWASYDRHFFRWAEAAGYAVDLATQDELHFRPELLEAYDCLVFTGHDEYWTWEMRDAVEAFVARGGAAARFAGNFMWQTRLLNEGQQQLCFKYRAQAEDPLFGGPDQARTTTSWEAAEVGRPGAETFGLNATRGLYVGWGGCAPRAQRGFPVYRPEHWAFAGTGLYYGDQLGAESQIFGYEVDGLDYVIRNGLPEATGREGAPEGVEILALGLATTIEENADIPVEGQFLTDVDARFVARTLMGHDGPEALEATKRGSGMIVAFDKGKGSVFHAGSCEWVAGLLRGDAQVAKVTSNVLNHFLSRNSAS
ncbi:MAG: N,N-dimethylformamidase beta subunit family domain-containing protein [Pseudomonadota bacterium]